jgi:hypothetical protein
MNYFGFLGNDQDQVLGMGTETPILNRLITPFVNLLLR